MKRRLALTLCLLLCLVSTALAQNITPLLLDRTTLHRDEFPYDSTPLSEETVRLLLEAGFSAPSGGNQLCLNYYVITEREKMQTIQSGHPYSTALTTAPLVIVVAGDEANCKYPELIEMDAGLSAMAMLTEATDLGLSTCVMSIWPQEERVNAVRLATEMPETMKPVLMVSFGVPAADVISTASVLNYDSGKVHGTSADVVTAATPEAVSSATSAPAADAAAFDVLSMLTDGKTDWSFSADPVDSADLEIVLRAGINTASAINEQPWLINAVTDPDIIAELADTEESKKAPVMLLVSVTNSNEMKILDAGLAVQSMQIAARALGYATKVETAPARTVRNDDTGKWASLFGIPADKSARAALFIGGKNPEADTVSSASARSSIEDVVHFLPEK